MRTNSLFLVVLLLGACTARNTEAPLDPFGILPMPETIAASEAANHLDQLVTLETTVAAARVQRGQVILQPQGQGPEGLSVVIAPPLLGPSASELAEKYRGQEILAIGSVSNFGGRLEMLIGDPDRVRLAGDRSPAKHAIEVDVPPGQQAVFVVDEYPAAAASPPTPARVPGGAAVGGAVVAAPVAAPVAVPVATPRPADSSATDAARQSAEADRACAAARRAWREAAATARAPMEELLACFDRGEPRCTPTATRARIALAEVAASEERLRWVCGGNE